MRDVPRVGALLVLFGLLFTALSTGCRNGYSSNEVVIYVSADETVARPILAAFEASSGLRVRAVFDTEATKTTGLVSRLLSERERPRADLFWSSECFRMIELAQQEVLASLQGAPFDSWMSQRDGQWRGDGGAWFGFAPRARVLVYVPGRIPQTELPRYWTDLADESWEGKIAMADPRFGTTSGHMGVLRAIWGAPLFDEWVEGLKRNEMALLTTGNSGVVRSVVSGEYLLGMTDTDDVWASRRQGDAVDQIQLRHLPEGQDGGGTLLIPNTVALVRGGPNPEGGRLLAEWLLSVDVENLLAASDSRNIPLRSEPGELAVDDPLVVDLVRSTKELPVAVERVHAALLSSEDG
jgi:iron(III) transport system substrate-binding protein